jgi:hypothetical protein
LYMNITYMYAVDGILNIEVTEWGTLHGNYVWTH